MESPLSTLSSLSSLSGVAQLVVAAMAQQASPHLKGQAPPTADERTGDEHSLSPFERALALVLPEPAPPSTGTGE